MANALVWQANEGAVTNRSRLRSPEDIQPCPCGEHLTHRIDTESTRTVVPGDVKRRVPITGGPHGCGNLRLEVMEVFRHRPRWR